jgi:hypothetical protein
MSGNLIRFKYTIQFVFTGFAIPFADFLTTISRKSTTGQQNPG